MNERKRLERMGAAADASDAIVATLSARLDALLASWQLAIQAQRKASPATDAKPRAPADVLADLQRELEGLEQHVAELRYEVDTESQSAKNWEQRAMIALRDSREDLAKQALHQQQQHANAAAVQESEAIELEAVRDAYRNAVAAVQASLER